MKSSSLQRVVKANGNLVQMLELEFLLCQLSNLTTQPVFSNLPFFFLTEVQF